MNVFLFWRFLTYISNVWDLRRMPFWDNRLLLLLLRIENFLDFWNSLFGKTEASRLLLLLDFISFNQTESCGFWPPLSCHIFSPVTARNESFFTSWEKKPKSHPINTTNFYGLRTSWRKIDLRVNLMHQVCFQFKFFLLLVSGLGTFGCMWAIFLRTVNGKRTGQTF